MSATRIAAALVSITCALAVASPASASPDVHLELDAAELTLQDHTAATADGALEYDGQRLGPSPWNWVLGGALILVSAPALGYGLSTAIQDGDCLATTAAGECTSRVRFGSGSAILTVLGGLAFVGGIVSWILQPIRERQRVRVRVEASDRGAALSIAGVF